MRRARWESCFAVLVLGAGGAVAGSFAWSPAVAAGFVVLWIACGLGLLFDREGLGAFALGLAGTAAFAGWELQESWHRAVMVGQLLVPLVWLASPRRRGRTFGTQWRHFVSMAGLGGAMPLLTVFGLYGLTEVPARDFSLAYLGALVLGVAAVSGLWRGRVWGLFAAGLAAGVLALFEAPPPWWRAFGCMALVHPADTWVRWVAVGLLTCSVAPWVGPMSRSILARGEEAAP